MQDRKAFRRTLTTIWALQGLAFLAGLALLTSCNIAFDWPAALNQNVLLIALCAPIALFYCTVRFEGRIASGLGTWVFIMAFPMAFAPLSYATTALAGGSHLWDGQLATWDKSIGYDWLAALAFADRHPMVAALLRTPYLSIIDQCLALIVLLTLRAEYEHAQKLCLAVTMALTACIATSAFMPTVGVYTYFNLQPDQHANIALATTTREGAHVMALRDGSFAKFSFQSAMGILTFPSFHAVLAVLFAWSGWRIPGLRWGFAALNGGMLAATPLHGGHYLVDVLAGGSIAVVAIYFSEKLRSWIGADAASVSATCSDPLAAHAGR
ncbi:hypothetical protein GCM10007036_32780 [Alsobacter metallidurans]|uniref:Inositolphosphotransferase Aur1/Ipt1 domain-containing protein n=1 Tax=Alsobacter metallidurans TaxID=340221 RepID=A0A917I8G6_9HYPH|nr:phosphatase PAP2 family protein [Alsobacter metallidurans]GGH25565.1 hypothetical protein GCM10007036_32780 [Alsobacter metallidurans]